MLIGRLTSPILLHPQLELDCTVGETLRSPALPARDDGLKAFKFKRSRVMEPYILVVDDDSDGREMLAEFLAFGGFEVATAANGETAIEVALRRPPTIILMDLTMPGMGGWEATRRLKADTRTKEVTVIAVTANAIDCDEAKAIAVGCDGFVLKPYDLIALGQMVDRFMTKRTAAVDGAPVTKTSVADSQL